MAERSTGILPVLAEQDLCAAHGLEAHATAECSTGILPVLADRDLCAAHGLEAHATAQPDGFSFSLQRFRVDCAPYAKQGTRVPTVRRLA